MFRIFPLTSPTLCAPQVRQKGAPLRLAPPQILAAPPIEAQAILPTLYDVEEFAVLYHAHKNRAIALVAAMTEPQRVRQVLSYAAWLEHHGSQLDLATVLDTWEGP